MPLPAPGPPRTKITMTFLLSRTGADIGEKRQHSINCRCGERARGDGLPVWAGQMQDSSACGA